MVTRTRLRRPVKSTRVGATIFRDDGNGERILEQIKQVLRSIRNKLSAIDFESLDDRAKATYLKVIDATKDLENKVGFTDDFKKKVRLGVINLHDLERSLKLLRGIERTTGEAAKRIAASINPSINPLLRIMKSLKTIVNWIANFAAQKVIETRYKESKTDSLNRIKKHIDRTVRTSVKRYIIDGTSRDIVKQLIKIDAKLQMIAKTGDALSSVDARAADSLIRKAAQSIKTHELDEAYGFVRKAILYTQKMGRGNGAKSLTDDLYLVLNDIVLFKRNLFNVNT